MQKQPQNMKHLLNVGAFIMYVGDILNTIISTIIRILLYIITQYKVQAIITIIYQYKSMSKKLQNKLYEQMRDVYGR